MTPGLVIPKSSLLWQDCAPFSGLACRLRKRIHVYYCSSSHLSGENMFGGRKNVTQADTFAQCRHPKWQLDHDLADLGETP
jgi:hypothetical protein